MNALPNTSILFRFFKAESPYIKAFIHHYTNLGAKHFIAIVQCRTDKQEIENKFAQLNSKSNLYILEMPNSWATNRCLRSFDHKKIPKIEEFILNIDCDELLFVEGEQHFIDAELPSYHVYHKKLHPVQPPLPPRNRWNRRRKMHSRRL